MDRDLMRRTSVVLVVLLLGTAACTVESSGTSQSSDTNDDTIDLLHDRDAAARALRAIERRVGASPAQLTGADVYGEYVIVEAQDPGTPDHIDRYTWRDGNVEPPEPVHLSGPQEAVDASLFPSAALRWGDLAAFVRKAEQRALHAEPVRIEQAKANYVDIARSTSSDDDGRVIVRVSIEGPRRSGYVEMTTSGDVRSVEVS